MTETEIKQNINEETPAAAQATEPQTVEVQEETTEENMVCPDCGAIYEASEEECEDCGTELVAESKMQQENDEEEGIEQTTATGQTIIIKNIEPPKPREPKKELTLKPNSRQIEGWNKTIKVMQALEMDEATFTYNGNIGVNVMDKSRTSMVCATIDMGLGISALVTETPEVTRKFTCDLLELKRALRMDNASIAIGQDEMIVSNKDTKVKIPLVDDDDQQIPVPNLPAGTKVKIDFDNVFKEMTKYLGSENIPDVLTINVAAGKASVKGTNVHDQSFEMVDFTAEGADAYNDFSSNMLKSLRDSSWNSKWDISFSTDKPIVAKTTINHTDYSPKNKSVDVVDATLTVYLAPRVRESQ